MKSIRRILWASDGLKESNFALKYSEFLAKQFQAQIIGLYVIPYLEHIICGYPTEILGWFKEAEESAHKRLEETKERLRESGIKFKTVVVKGTPHQEILSISRREKADLVVMGKRGYESVERDPLGSTTIKVLRESSIPVLTTKYNKGRIGIREILVPVDFSKMRSDVLEYPINLAQKFKAKIHLLNVFELNNFDKYPKQFLDILKTPFIEEIEKLASKVPSKGVLIEPKVIVAPNAWRGIVDFVGKEDIDLVVIPTHGRKGISRFFLGSIAERVIQEAPCSVLSINPQYKPGKEF